MAGSASSNPIFEINTTFLRGALGLGLGWGAWQIASPELWLFGWVAIVAAAAGTIKVAQGLFGVVKLIRGQRKLAKYERKGVAPKADAMAQERELRARGLIK